jgi:nitronate monooxygenase
MLEAERAGAKALVVYMDSFERNSETWKTLRQIQADEAHNCALIGKLLEKSGTPYSHATGKFYDKAVAVKEPRARLEFLVRGLKWAVRRFEQALPSLDPEARAVFAKMRDSHLRTIAACEKLTQ